jgi:hypothetical protein
MRFGGLYLDYTYRDLSTASNRRLFVDADGLYVAPPTSGILSLAMTDATSVATNSGTGGDFTLNGTVAQSGRDALQYNAAASEFDGSSDTTSNNSVTGLSASNAGTFSFWFNSDILNQRPICGFGASGYTGSIQIDVDSSSLGIQLLAYNTSNSLVADFRVGFSTALATNKWHHCVITFDLSDTSKRDIRINGVAQSVTYSTYTDGTINWASNAFRIGESGSSYFDGGISDFWFDDSYIDLSSSNPFYDTSTSKPKNLGGDGSTPTGSSPLVYLPLRANNPDINKGTGGNFSGSSVPFIGARGPSEFWGEAGEFNGSNQRMLSTTNLGFDSTTQYTVVFSIYMDAYVSRCVFDFKGGASPSTFYGGIQWEDSGGDSAFKVYNADGSLIINGGPDSNNPIGASGWYNVLISCDLSSTSKRWYYVNDSVPSSLKWRSYNTSGSSNLGLMNYCSIGSRAFGGNYFDGRIGFLYVHQTYFDFSVEANRRKFFDALGYPVDLGSDGSNPSGDQPHVYLNAGFHNGTNLGAGGNFTPSNTPTDGGYVKG